jgi:hypothetical protein
MSDINPEVNGTDCPPSYRPPMRETGRPMHLHRREAHSSTHLEGMRGDKYQGLTDSLQREGTKIAPRKPITAGWEKEGTQS